MTKKKLRQKVFRQIRSATGLRPNVVRVLARDIVAASGFLSSTLCGIDDFDTYKRYSEARLEAIGALALDCSRCPGSEGEPCVSGPKGTLYSEDFDWLRNLEPQRA